MHLVAASSSSAHAQSPTAKRKSIVTKQHPAEEFRWPIQRKVHWLLHQFFYDAFLGLTIMLNLVLVIIETDAGSKGDASPAWTNLAGRIIIVIFVVDVTLQIFVAGITFFYNGMNIFDFAVIFTDVVMNIVELIAGPVLSVSILRVVRLSKLARVAKAFRIFTELRLLLAGLLGSMKAIFWGTVLLVLCLTVWAVIAVQFLHPLNEAIAATGKYGDCERCGRVYATVFDAFIVFFQQIVAGDSWGMVTVTVIEEYPLTLFVYGPIFLSIGLAVLNLMLGVVVDVASQARGSLVGQMLEDENLAKMEAQHRLTEMCEDLDTLGNGCLMKEDLTQGFQHNEDFRKSLAGMSLTEPDLDILWRILDEDQSGSISYVDFCSYCYKMRSSKEEFMLTYIKYYVTLIKSDICEEIALVKEEMTKQDEQAERMANIILNEERVIEQQIDSQTQQMNAKVNHIEEELLQQAVNIGGTSAIVIGKEPRQASDGAIQNSQTKAAEEKMRNADFHMEIKDLTIDRTQVLAEVTESMNARQGELLAAIQSMKDKLDDTFDRLTTPGSLSSASSRTGLSTKQLCSL